MSHSDREVSPLQVIQMIWGFMLSQALHVAAKLSLIDHLKGGAKDLRTLARASGSNELALHRLLRFLTSVGLLVEDDQGRFSQTDLGEFLRSDHPQSVRPLAMMYGDPFLWRSWGNLYETIRTGKPGFERVHGEPFFSYVSHHSAEAEIFDAAMASATAVDLPFILDAYDFSGFAKIVDVGGGNGALLKGILDRYPRLHGVLCDVPSVVEGARDNLTSSFAGRCEIVAADILESIPGGGDAYMLKRILHDWGDSEAVQILRNCGHAMSPAGKVLVMESMVQAPNQPDPAKWLDLNMLVLVPGRERTEDEFGALFATAGLRLTRVIPATRLSIVEGVPA